MAGTLFIVPGKEGEKRSREVDRSGWPPTKRVRPSYEPDPLTRRPRGSNIKHPGQEQAQKVGQPVRSSQFFRKLENPKVSTTKNPRGRIPAGSSPGKFTPNRTSRVPSGTTSSSTDRFVPGQTFRHPYESSSSETSRSSESTERLSYSEIMHDIQRARRELQDLLAGRRPILETPNPGEPPKKLTRKNLAKHRRAERKRFAKERRKAMTLPPLPPVLRHNPPIFAQVDWDKGASQSYRDNSISPRMK
ncbi:hypothetical protein Daesc_000363 [Daldinia eschscholtzii]|uniref:Uncharacterized protein n=1 Tax=Daldinia eschscholtzii TaxID=292717 RepID=A0AAX6MYH4_9PEZI